VGEMIGDKDIFLGKLQAGSRQVLKNNKDVLALVLSGSRARGDYKKDSDYDISIITKCGSSFVLHSKYSRELANFTKIDSLLLSVHIWPISRFKTQYAKGDSFVYTMIRDGIVLAKRNRSVIEISLPSSCEKAGAERIEIAKKIAERINLYFGNFSDKGRAPGFLKEELGFSCMHFCWGICLTNNFCPKSKYTLLKECSVLFNKSEMVFLKKVYGSYKCRDKFLLRESNKKIILDECKKLSSLIESKVGGGARVW
jgi:predicted nucleotidyltransferase